MQNSNEQKSIAVYTTLAAKLYHAMLWPNHTASAKEIKLIHRRIHAEISNDAAPYTRYIEFVERLCIAQRYNLLHTGAPYFTLWLYRGYKYGITSTDICYQHLQTTRAVNPLFYASQKAFAHAMLDIFEEGKQMQIYWTQWFTQRAETKFAALINSLVFMTDNAQADE